jgi:DNA-directed RNA polymerase subunit M/transcription elongation factor TFIIS
MLSKFTDQDLESILDRYFPKGDKARGRALVLFAHAQIYIDELELMITELENAKVDREIKPEEKFNCSKCKHELKFGYKFCPECGSQQLWGLFG